jgi:hypothetical protein
MERVFNYAVVHWYHYRKELSAGFIAAFDDFDAAQKYAYSLAHEDMKRYGTSEKVITEDEITDVNGPGKNGSPYNTIIGYGGRYANGYSTRFYCVVEWFDGVTNSWDSYDDDSDDDEDDDEWYPRYG